MSDDLIARLRAMEIHLTGIVVVSKNLHNPDGPEAADRIEALQAENARLREAMEATNKLIYTARDKVPEDDETLLSDLFAHYLNRATGLIRAALKEKP